MANPKQLARLRKGIEAWNRWKELDPEIGWGLREANLSDAKLREAKLDNANLSSTDLRRADLSGASLRRALLFSSDLTDALVSNASLSNAQLKSAVLSKANFYGSNLIYADLEGADLTGANLSETSLRWSNLRGADLSNAKLVGADLTGADMLGANFTHAEVGSTVFGTMDLSNVSGLETVEHQSGSVIGIDTIYLSSGKIPGMFLRGCGVPDDFMVYMASLIASPIEFYSCFISYSTKDHDFADRLYSDLQNKGVRCWFASHDVQGGRKLHEQIDEAIRLHDKLLLILSPHSMESEWVKTEIAKARKREVRDQRRVLFPIRLAPFEILRDWECFDADTGKDSAREIREYFIPDFSNWKNHDSYQEAFQRLVSDLKSQDSKSK